MIDVEELKRIYEKSIEVLKKVQLRNGGCLATPKGERYPYIYPRDHSFITLGFLSAGLYERAKKALNFIFNCQLKSGAFPQRIDTKGRDASYKPIQLDGTSMVLYSLGKYIKATGDYSFAKENFQGVKRAVRYILKNLYIDINGQYELVRGHTLKAYLIFTPNSVHEYPPTEKGLEIWANSVSCAALREMYELSKKLGKQQKKWRNYSLKIKNGILEYMWNSQRRTFLKNIRIRESSSILVYPDVSKYAVAEFDVLKDNDERVMLTVKEIEKNLWNKDLGGLCRYPKYEGRNNGGWGPWPNYTLMICRHFIKLKNRKKADKYLNWILKISRNYMLPEHISTIKEFEEYVNDFKEAGILRKDREIMVRNARKNPMFKKGIAYITLPLAWSHAEFIRTFNLYKDIF